MQTMQQYITEMGLEYSQKQFDACLTAFVSEMERGLAGGASSLKMIPAYLDAQAPPSDGGPVIASIPCQGHKVIWSAANFSNRLRSIFFR